MTDCSDHTHAIMTLPGGAICYRCLECDTMFVAPAIPERRVRTWWERLADWLTEPIT